MYYSTEPGDDYKLFQIACNIPQLIKHTIPPTTAPSKAIPSPVSIPMIIM